MKKTCLLAVAAGMACCSVALAGPPVKKLRAGAEVQPISYARAMMVNGKPVMVGDWIAYDGAVNTRNPEVHAPAFDCFGRVPANNPSGQAGTGCTPSCDTAPDNGGRWYIGYHNPNTVEDMQDCQCPPGAEMSEMDFGWFWTVTAQCYIAIFPFEEVLAYDGNTGLCQDPDTFTVTGAGFGVIWNYGNLPGATTHYWYSRPVLPAGFGVVFPASDKGGDPNFVDGSYQQIFANAVTSSQITLAAGPCEPMLWGTSTGWDGQSSTGPADCRPGVNNNDSYDDFSPADGIFTQNECRDYGNSGVCPSPLGKDNGFCYRRCPADFNNDGFVDGIDYDNFNNDFESTDPAMQNCADLNGDCFVDGIDYDTFNNEFESPCP